MLDDCRNADFLSEKETAGAPALRPKARSLRYRRQGLYADKTPTKTAARRHFDRGVLTGLGRLDLDPEESADRNSDQVGDPDRERDQDQV